ncbi:MAG: phosphoserine phosphatase SerB [Pseudomonadota bacterium]|nr:phosphoserine phosphatase SerB [Pseudomonadota bacterium]
MHQTAVFSSSTRGSVTAEIASGILGAAGIDADLAAVRVLDEAHALDLPLPETVDVDGMATLRARGDLQGIDVNIVPSEGRRKQLLIADMDSTVITSESLDDMARLAGIADDILPITTRAMRGELDFEQALDARLALFAGKPASLVDEALAEVEFSGGATTLVRTMRAAGASCYLVSGGFTVITEPVAERCGFTGTHANHLEIEGGKLLGKVRKPVLDSGAKARYLAHYCAELGIAPAEAACIGDGANDLDMLEAAGFGVAFHGKPLLREKIPLQLNHTDLTGLLYLQGYTADAFISG